VDIVLHLDKLPIGNKTVVKLKYLQLSILVKLTCTRTSKLNGLESSVIPVEFEMTSIQINIPTMEGKTKKCMVRRKQYPIMLAYAFTNY